MTACKCNERHRPTAQSLPEGSNKRPRQWFVTRRNESRSAFNGYRPEWSKSSDVHCYVCGAYWRTSASYVRELKDCAYFPFSNPPKVEPIDD